VKYKVSKHFSVHAKYYEIGEELDEETLSLPVLNGLIEKGNIKRIYTLMHIPSNLQRDESEMKNDGSK
jgi:hypothetical protein